jgi:two-component system, response regulator
MKLESRLPTILLVEDNIDDHDAAMRSFKVAHLHNPIHWSNTGRDALDYLKFQGVYADTPSRELPGLILLDLNMPGLDGRAVLESVKKSPCLKKIPVIILTTSSDERDVAKCYELGASTYVQKPVSFDGLLDAIKRIKDYWFGIAILPGGSQCKTL